MTPSQSTKPKITAQEENAYIGSMKSMLSLKAREFYMTQRFFDYISEPLLCSLSKY